MAKKVEKTEVLNLIAPQRKYIYFALLIALVLDGFSIYMLFNTGHSFNYMIMPVIMAAIDLLFIIMTGMINPRVKSSFYTYLVYVGLEIIAVVMTMILYSFTTTNVIMTSNACFFLGVVKVTFLCLFCLMILYSQHRKDNINKMTVRAVTLASAVISLIYVIFTFAFGFFGQGPKDRELVYNYEKSTNTYCVVGYANETGNTLKIPSEFNGKAVSGFNMKLLEDEALEHVVVEDREEALVVYPSSDFKGVSSSLKSIEASKENIESIRMSFYEYGLAEALELLVPTGMGNDDVFVTFKNTDGDFLKTWYGKNGEPISLDYDSSVEFISKSDAKNDEHLAWNYEHNGQKILSGIYDGDTNIANKPITKPVYNATMVFENIYKVTLAESNDPKYNSSNPFLLHQYTTLENANKALDFNIEREGYTLSYMVNDEEITDLKAYFEAHNDVTSVEIVPTWKFKAPVINAITGADLDDIHYGDSIALTVDIDTSEVPEGAKLNYKWTAEGKEVVESSSATWTLNNIKTTKSGEYVVTVYYTNTKTPKVLYEVGTKAFTLDVKAREITFNWDIPTEVTYGDDLPFKCYFDSSNVLEADKSNFLNNVTVKIGNTTITPKNRNNNVVLFSTASLEAGSSNLTISLPASYQGKYAVSLSGESTITIAKKVITVTVNNASVSQGSEKPAFTVSYSEFVGTDNENTAFGGKLNFSCAYTTSATAGQTFEISVSGLYEINNNYEIKYVKGTLTVTE